MKKPIIFSLSTFLFMLVLLGLVTVSSQASHVDCDLFLETKDYAPPPPDIHDVRGHGGGYRFLPTAHGHGIVKLYGFGLFIIRAADRTAVPAIAIPPRLGKVCKQLDEAIERLEENPNLFFKIDRHRGRLSIVQVSEDGDHHEKIINIVQGDAIGYKSRDVHGRNISPELVAQYWLAVLEDTVSVFVLSRKPEKLTYTHAGEVLQAIYELARQEQSSGRISEEVFEDIVLNKLTHEQKEHLGALAFYIPGEFPSGLGIIQPDEGHEEEDDGHESETKGHEEITEPKTKPEHDDESEPVPLPIDIISTEDNSPLASITKTESTLRITASPDSSSDRIDLVSVLVEVLSQQGSLLHRMIIPLAGQPPLDFPLVLPEEGAKGEVFTKGNSVSLLVKGRYNGKETEAKFTGITISPSNGANSGVVKKLFGGLVLLVAVATGLFFLLRKFFGSKRMTVTLVLEDGQKSVEKPFTLEPGQEIAFGPTGGDYQWPIGSQDRIRYVGGKLYLRRSDGTPPERLSVGSRFEVSRTTVSGPAYLQIKEISRGRLPTPNS